MMPTSSNITGDSFQRNTLRRIAANALTKQHHTFRFFYFPYPASGSGISRRDEP